MKTIIITDLEYQMLVKNVNRTFNPMQATKEEAEAMNSVIKKAEQLMSELDAYDELGDSLTAWYLRKYKEQQNI